MTIERFSIPEATLLADNNIRHQYPIHKGKWISHPEATRDEPSFCRYTLEFTLDAAVTIDLHVTADNRFELYCDGEYVGMGPDRSDVEHWSFHSYRVSLEAGTHRLSAEVHFGGLGMTNRPWAQTCIRPGFALLAENSPVDLDTGSAAWKVVKLAGVSTENEQLKAFLVVGPNYTFDAKAYFNEPPAVDPVVLQVVGRNNETGTMLVNWKVFPSRMPEQARHPVGGGRIRFVGDVDESAVYPPEETSASTDAWQAWIDGAAPLTIPANSKLNVLWDLEEYHCVFPEVTTSGGAGASVQMKFAEACLVNDIRGEGNAREKGNRNVFAGKYFFGLGDTYLPDGETRTFRPFWWRAGRYIRIIVETADAPLTLEKVQLIETRLPLENESVFKSSDAQIPPIIKIATRGIQMCAHETYMDCPYYEQMMYVGDTRLQMLTSYIMSSEDRLNQRALEIFDWSRLETGFVLERCPSQPKQLSCTFSMIWIMMLSDFAYWRDEPAFLRKRIKGMRCMIEEFKALLDDRAPLLPPLPGWSFMDWVQTLSYVNHPGPDAGVSSIVNLLFVNALNAAAELERLYGEPHLAEYNEAWADQIARKVDELFWNEQRGLFADDTKHERYSEHAQCLALLSGRFPHREARCFESLISADDLLRTTVYFSFYLLETFAKFDRGDLIVKKLDFWKEMETLGMKTPLESPEPSRSDCHAWASHPLFHMHASLAGIRPGDVGFKSVKIAPSPGPLTQLESEIPHPAGRVSLAMQLTDGGWQTRVMLPAGVEGTLEWKGESHALKDVTELKLPK